MNTYTCSRCKTKIRCASAFERDWAVVEHVGYLCYECYKGFCAIRNRHNTRRDVDLDFYISEGKKAKP